jgi:trans-aconitate 2-methyltransferase
MNYQFTDTDLAARRLACLAEVYEPPTRAFLMANAPKGVPLVVDLGCGPGHTTALLAEVCAAERALGVDASSRFIDLARTTYPDLLFEQCDVTGRMPIENADVIYCRYLLTHLPNPEALINSWVKYLNIGGSLLIEEVEDIDRDNDLVSRYLTIVENMLHHQGHELNVGRILGAIEIANVTPRVSQTQSVDIDLQDAAKLFHMNIQSWKHQPFIHENYATGEIEALQAELNDCANRPSDRTIRWRHRQIVLQRQGN